MKTPILYVCAMVVLYNVFAVRDAKCTTSGRTVLQQAVVDRKNDEVAFLISEGVDINRVDNFQWTALHHAVTFNNLGALDRLIAAHANLNMQTKRGETPLHMAVGLGYTAVVAKLIVAGADLTIVDENGDTPLHVAVQWGWPDVVRLLLQAGADRTVKNNNGMTPSDIVSGSAVSLNIDAQRAVANIFSGTVESHNYSKNFMDVAREHSVLVAGIITAMMTVVMALIRCAHHPQAAALGAVAAVVNQQPLERLISAGIAVRTPLVQAALKE